MLKKKKLLLAGLALFALSAAVFLEWQRHSTSERHAKEEAWRAAWKKPIPAAKVPASTASSVPVDEHGLPVLSDTPTDSEIATCRAFSRALVPVDTGVGDRNADNAALAAFLREYRKLDHEAAWEKLREYLRGPVSPRWKAALQIELAGGLFERGFFVDAQDVWQKVWGELKDSRDLNALSIADEAAGRMLDLGIGRGAAGDLRKLIVENENRPYHGALEGKLLRAQQAVWLLGHNGAQNIMCGTRALNAILDHQHIDYVPIVLSKVTGDYIATGLPMTELANFATSEGWATQFARRVDPAAPIPTPAVLHLKEGHYASLVEADQKQGRYFMVDRGLGFSGWVSREAVDQLSSGNFLLAEGALPTGFQSLAEKDAANIFGRDGIHGIQPPEESVTPDVPSTGGDGGSCQGMARYTFLPQMPALRVQDNPVGYDPPVGPSVRLVLSYHDVDGGEPTSPAQANAGRMWNVNWIAWLTPPTGTLTNSSAVAIRLPGGGTEKSTYNTTTLQFGPHDRSLAVVKRISATNYERLLPDGSKEVYDQPGNAANPTALYLRQFVDPQGNAITLTYNAQMQLTQVRDAIGQITTLSYNHPTDPLKITAVADPFGRQATLAYNAAGQLTSITDVIGLVSAFTYAATGDQIHTLTTPYGTTTFSISGAIQAAGSTSPSNRVIEVTDPQGDKERVQYVESVDATQIATANPAPRFAFVGGQQVAFFAENDRLQYRNSYYWSKKAMSEAPGDITKARNYRWYTDKDTYVVPVLEAIKEALEDRVWFNYPGAAVNQKTGQSGYPNYPGKGARPEKIIRVLADGSPQMVQSYYNAQGMPLKTIDPVGRTTEFTYAANGLDLIETRQTTGGTNQRLNAITYNSQHLPLTVTDAAGQVTTFTYNPRGQALTVTNANNGVTTFGYDANGYLTTINGPLAGAGDTTSFTYDAKGRARTVTGPDGYVLTYDYDDFDRVTKITYPDTTFNAFTYDKLNRISSRDRLGRVTAFEYNTVRQLTKITDPANRSVLYEWCKCGDLFKLTDPMGRETRWKHDVQGRVTGKTYADGSQIRYEYEPQTSRLARRIDEKGQTTLYSYNLDNTLRSKAYPDAQNATPTVTFTYDTVFNRVISMTDGIGATNYVYHAITGGAAQGAGRLSSVDGPWLNDTVSYVYDKLGRVINRSINGAANSQDVAYDTAGRVSSITNPLGMFTYDYVPNTFRPVSVTHSGGMRTEYSWLPNSQDRRLQRIRHLKPGGAQLSVFEHTYDAAGRILTWSQQDDTSIPKVWTIGYDTADQLTSGVLTQGGTTLDNYTWTYDRAGNRLTEARNGTNTTTSYNTLNELTHSSANQPAVTYEWDAEQRLIAINQGAARTEFAYDGYGRRVKTIEKSNGSIDSSSIYKWCGLAISELRNESGETSQLRYYTQGTSGTTFGNVLHTRDHLRSIRESVTVDGLERERVSYDLWGNPVISNSTPVSDFGFTGHYWHGRSNLLLAPFRSLSPRFGRWLSRDPLGEAEGPNLFMYASNDPCNRFDLLGLEFSAAVQVPSKYGANVIAQFFIIGFEGDANISVQLYPLDIVVSASAAVGIGTGLGLATSVIGGQCSSEPAKTGVNLDPSIHGFAGLLAAITGSATGSDWSNAPELSTGTAGVGVGLGGGVFVGPQITVSISSKDTIEAIFGIFE